MDAILNLIKPPGMTSHDVVSYTRKMFRGIKTGHTGTLDPAAAGVLPVCLGKATRVSSFLLEGRKGYRGEVILGVETDSLDSEGKEISRQIVSGVSAEKVQEVLSGYAGEIEQVPPAHSAIRYRGRRAYEWAHQGEKISLPPRKVKIYNISLVEFIKDSFPRIIFEVECSHGTYIRSLAVQIGKDLGFGAHLSFLLRSYVGSFKLDNASTLESLKIAVDKQKVIKMAFPMDYALQHIKKVNVTDEAIHYLAQGNHLFKEQIVVESGELTDKEKGELYRVYDMQQNFWGLGRWENTSRGEMFKPEKILRSYRGDS